MKYIISLLDRDTGELCSLMYLRGHFFRQYADGSISRADEEDIRTAHDGLEEEYYE